MKAHRSLQRLDILRYSRDKIALMVASEFLRASSRAEYQQVVRACFERAKELMGILETIELDAEVAKQLRPHYQECSRATFMATEKEFSPDMVRQFSDKLARAFERASTQLKESPHA
jgi:hypothetical protein